jgi:hypothetical protein
MRGRVLRRLGDIVLREWRRILLIGIAVLAVLLGLFMGRAH